MRGHPQNPIEKIEKEGESDKMKKKMGLLGGLLMAVVVTAYSVAGTYAKYISTFDMADEARVAKWNFNDKAEHTVDLFQASYTNENGIYVATSDTSKVIAPGTEGLYEYRIEGTAETNYKVTKNIKIVNKVVLATEKGSWNEGTLLYNPVVFKVTDREGNETTLTAPAKVEYDANNDPYIVYEVAVADTTVYAANTTLTEPGSISWAWGFETGTENALGTYSNDSLDTTLGERIAASLEKGETGRYNITATVGITVEQTTEAPTTGTTKAPVYMNTFADDAYVVDTLGIAKDSYSKVVFNGTALNGTIYSSINDKADAQMGRAASGYYYPLSIKVDPKEISKVTIKDTWYDPAVQKYPDNPDANYEANGKVHNSVYDIDENGDGELPLIYGLKENVDLVYVLEYRDGTTPAKEITIKNNLNFVK